MGITVAHRFLMIGHRLHGSIESGHRKTGSGRRRSGVAHGETGRRKTGHRSNIAHGKTAMTIASGAFGYQRHWDNRSWYGSWHDTQSLYSMPRPAPVIDFRPPWCTDNDPRKHVEVWYDELVGRFKCDRDSIRELYGLAQLSQRGYEEANAIVWKMCKKVCDNEHIDNPSAFLHKRVKTAREELQGKNTSSCGSSN